MFSETDRDAALESAIAPLKDDERVEAIVLTGSLGRGAGDRWSDIDLDAVIGEGADVEVVTGEWEAIGWDSDDFTRVDDLPAEETQPLEATLIASLDRDGLLDAIGMATRAFLDELGRHDRDLADRLGDPLLAIVSA